MDYPMIHMLRYYGASPEMREKTKAHWIKCYANDLANNLSESADMSARIIANMALVDSGVLSECIEEFKKELLSKQKG